VAEQKKMRRRSFTLLELLLVLIILGLIASFVFPDLARALQGRSLQESAERLRSIVVMLHSRSMQDGRRYRVEFPGTPDPNDKYADEEVYVPVETEQPIVKRQADPLGNPDLFEDVHEDWTDQDFMQDGTRCIAVFPGTPNFDCSQGKLIAGPDISEGITTFVPLTFNPDGTSDWVTIILTDLPPDTELLPEHVSRILNVIVDGRTGQTWIQRALLCEEVELMQEYGASPILHIDFTSTEMITEDNILHIKVRQGGGATGGRHHSQK